MGGTLYLVQPSNLLRAFVVPRVGRQQLVHHLLYPQLQLSIPEFHQGTNQQAAVVLQTPVQSKSVHCQCLSSGQHQTMTRVSRLNVQKQSSLIHHRLFRGTRGPLLMRYQNHILSQFLASNHHLHPLLLE